MTDDKQAKIQERLFLARKLLCEAGQLADEAGTDVNFMGLVYEPSFGWFDYSGELQEASEWNSSDCVIGSRFAAYYGGEGWNDPNWPFKSRSRFDR